jgi:hypothetical protein
MKIRMMDATACRWKPRASWLCILLAFNFSIASAKKETQAIRKAAHQVPEIGWTRTGFGSKKLAPLMWRHYSEAEIDSLNALR